MAPKKRGLPAQRIDAGLLHCALDRDALVGVFLDEDAHLRILQVVLGEPACDGALGFRRRHSAHGSRADERQRHHAERIHADRACELVHAEHLDLDEVLRTDAIFAKAHARGGVYGGSIAVRRQASAGAPVSRAEHPSKAAATGAAPPWARPAHARPPLRARRESVAVLPLPFG
jgi:hypothetical protein